LVLGLQGGNPVVFFQRDTIKACFERYAREKNHPLPGLIPLQRPGMYCLRKEM
jgi:hypothetical protein